MNKAGSIFNLRLDEYRENGYLTHGIHPYPAKFIPQIPREIIEKLTSKGDCIYDPFCGSGTTLAEAVIMGRNAIGTDVNPLSCKIARAKSIPLTVRQLREVGAFLDELSEEKLVALKPNIPDFFGIDKWFSPRAQHDLASLLSLIRQRADMDVVNFLEVVFSSIVVRASNQESDTRYKAIVKKLDAGAITAMYRAKLTEALNRAKQFADVTASSPARSRVFELDSTMAHPDADKAVKLVVTSPPYMNSYDYYLYHKHRLNWLGLNVADTQEREFGSRNKHNDKGLGVEVYNDAIRRSILLTREIMSEDSHYCVVVGDSIWRGQLIKMNTNYDSVFESAGFSKVEELAFPQRKYTRSFTSNFRTQHKDTYILLYAK